MMGLLDFIGGYKSFGKKTITVCDSYDEVSNDVVFRLSNDADNVLRIKQDYWVASPHEWRIADEEWNVEVAGVSHRIENVMNFIAGSSHRIKLTQEAMPKFPHAIAVYGEFIEQRGKNQRTQLGYLPNDLAKEITKGLKNYKDYLLLAKLQKMFIPTREKDFPGLRIDVGIFHPALPSFEVHGYDRKSGRKRKRTFIAKDKEDAILQANSVGIIVDVNSVIQK